EHVPPKSFTQARIQEPPGIPIAARCRSGWAMTTRRYRLNNTQLAPAEMQISTQSNSLHMHPGTAQQVAQRGRSKEIQMGHRLLLQWCSTPDLHRNLDV